MESSQEGTEAKLDSPTEKFDFKRHTLILEALREGVEIQSNETKNKREHATAEEKIKRVGKTPEFLDLKMKLMRDRGKMECLLEQMKSVQDEGKLEPQRWKMRLNENIEKAEVALQEMKWMPEEEGLEAPGVEMRLEEQIAKSELLQMEMELIQHVKEVKSPMLEMQLKGHMPKVESLLENVKLVQEESEMESPVLRMQLKELEFLLKKMKLVQKSGKLEYSTLEMEAHIVKLKLLLDGTELEKEKEELESQMLESTLLGDLITESKLMLKEGFTRLRSKDLPQHLKKIISVLEEMKSEQKEKMESAQEESNIKSPALGMQLKECIVELECVLKETKLENVKEKLKFRKLKIKLYSHIVELERLLKNMKLEQEEEGLRCQALKIELKEYIAKLELLLEETEVKEKHVAEWKGFILKAKKFKLVREESKIKSLMLQLEERTVALKSLLEEMKLVRWLDKTWDMDCRRHIVNLEFLLEGMEYKQKEQGLQSQELEMQLVEHTVKLELPVKEIESTRDVKILELKGHLGKVKSVLQATKLERDEEKLVFPALKVQLKERIVQMKSQPKPGKIELSKKALSLGKQLKERIGELEDLQEKTKLVQLIGELKCRALGVELNRHITNLQSLLKEIELEQERVPWPQTLEIKWQRYIQKSESLLKEIESEHNVEILQPLMWKMVLERYSEKTTSLLVERIKSPTLEIELKQHVAKLEFILLEMKLEQEEEGVGYQALEMELEEHIVKSELLLKERELVCDVGILKSPVSKIQLEEHLEKVKSRLVTMKLGREKRNQVEIMLKEHVDRLNVLRKEMKSERKEVKLESSAADVVLEPHIKNLEILLEEMKLEPKEGKLESSTEGRKLTPHDQKAPSTLIGPRPIIVIGGRDQDGLSLKSVEGYIFLEGRWIELPAMNTPRSFMSSVVVGQEVIVSGGDTGDTITDTIEVLNLAETPLQWKISPAKLPIPLSAHQTVVYKEKLIVVGGHDGNKGRNSDKIYEILLKPPYESRILSFLFIPVAWHGAELVGNEIFIFGGGKNPFVSTSDILAFDLSSSTLSKRQSLPRAMKGMATVMIGESIAVIGGLDDNEQELDEVFMYDTRSGEHHILPEMKDKRGGCSAVASFTLETRSSCSSEKFTDALFAVGSVRSLNTVEGYSFESHRWTDMPPTREARGFCSMVVAPIEFDTFIEHMIE